MDTNTRQTERQKAVAAAVADIHAIAQDQGVTPDSLAQIKSRLKALAAQAELFPEGDFPPPAGDTKFNANVYRVAEDDDHRFALYVQSARGKLDTPAHNHTTWAVIAGIQGGELNRFYDRTTDGAAAEKGQHVVAPGSAVAFMPDDLHSIHVDGHETVINFHMYGLALDHLHEREYFRESDGTWQNFPAHEGIIDAR